jgi:NAD+ kinase
VRHPAIGSVGVVAKRAPTAVALVRELVDWLQRRGHPVLLDAATRIATSRLDLSELGSETPCDLVVVLGGDGTLLSVARRHAGGPPILGVNLGRLGFLTEVARDGLYPALVEILEGDYEVEPRSLFEVVLERSSGRERSYLALNDAVIAKTALSRIIELNLAVDGRPVSRYRADGLVLSTPTGSTAYNLSAGGPILHPLLPVAVITPICPHTLTLRPLVVPDTSVIEVTLETPSESVYLTVDGQEGDEMAHGERVRLSRHAQSVHLVRTGDPRSIFEGLRSKLHWGE